jgi:hypothetical protein
MQPMSLEDTNTHMAYRVQAWPGPGRARAAASAMPCRHARSRNARLSVAWLTSPLQTSSMALTSSSEAPVASLMASRTFLLVGLVSVILARTMEGSGGRGALEAGEARP